MLKKLTGAIFALFSLFVQAEYVSPLVYKDVSCADLVEEFTGHQSNYSTNRYHASLAEVDVKPRSSLPVYLESMESSAGHMKAIKKAAAKIQCDLPKDD